MNPQRAPVSASRLARLAGLLYLAIIVCGLSGELLIRASLIVPGDPSATAANILGSPGLFRAGFLADTVMLLCDVALAVLFYQLFRTVSRPLALTAAVFRLVQAAVLAAGLLSYYAPALILADPAYAGLTDGARHAMAAFYLDLHAHGYDLGLIFFGVSSLVLGHLVRISGYFPGVLGYGLQAAGVVYLFGSLVRFLAPDLHGAVEPLYLVPLLAEVAFCLWLLFKGAETGPGPRAYSPEPVP